MSQRPEFYQLAQRQDFADMRARFDQPVRCNMSPVDPDPDQHLARCRVRHRRVGERQHLGAARWVISMNRARSGASIVSASPSNVIRKTPDLSL